MLSSNEAVGQLYDEWKQNSGINVIQEPQIEVFSRTFLVKDCNAPIKQAQSFEVFDFGFAVFDSFVFGLLR